MDIAGVARPLFVTKTYALVANASAAAIVLTPLVLARLPIISRFTLACAGNASTTWGIAIFRAPYFILATRTRIPLLTGADAPVALAMTRTIIDALITRRRLHGVNLVVTLV
jgi:hypothetical protein